MYLRSSLLLSILRQLISTKMTYEEAEKLLEEHESEFLTDKINNRFLEGLKILASFGELSTAAQHDIIYVAPWYEEMKEEDILQLYRLGFHLDEDSWAYFT
ncbi:MAG TPA: hypothetical protein VF762_14635 [Blastocatellia bacterium]